MQEATQFRLEARPHIPEGIARLESLANDLFYSWDSGVRSLYARIDSQLWQKVEHNPKLFLRRVSQAHLDDAAENQAFLAEYRRVLANYDAYVQSGPGHEVLEVMNPDTTLVAYFCAEFGFHESFPIYSGGLGILAGDHCKAASDLSLPFVAVGLLYQQGYFIQTIDAVGHQVARYQSHSSDELPITPVENDGEQLMVSVPFRGRDVYARIWQAQVGHMRLYLLDADTPDNSNEDRRLTLQLYGGDTSTRISQEMLLGIGGTRVLSALGIQPTVWHINEGHAAFQILERCRSTMALGLPFDAALEAVAACTLFTTHTPVAAGHDIFPRDLMADYLGPYIEASGLEFERIFALGNRHHSDQFNMTSLGLRGSRFHNGVSRIHGRVASEMEAGIWPQVPPEENPIGYITNGVHAATFLAPEWTSLFDIQAPNWKSELRNTEFWNFIDKIPDYHYWSVHKALKQQMTEFIGRRLERQHSRNGTGQSVTRRMTAKLTSPEKDAMVIGFARRFATYKRATLIFSDLPRLERILTNPDRPVVLVFAGKAHPQDHPGQQLIKVIHDLSMQPSLFGHIVLLEDYDQAMARRLLSGVDVWLNTPEYPKEASGTSGEKAAMNGAVNLSVLDGWWGEGYDGSNGWAITPRNTELDPEFRNREEARDLLDLLEHEVVPLYYNRAAQGYSEGWVSRSKASMKTITPRFNAQRMVMDYATNYYQPATRQGLRLMQNQGELARELADWKARIRSAWHGVSIKVRGCVEERCNWDEEVELTVELDLNGLAPEDVRVECMVTVECSGTHADPGPDSFLLQPAEELDGKTLFTARVTPPFPGLQTLRLRAYPYHEALTHPLEMGAMLWV
ncbi:MAG: alpha-glucan family phosphorylase [Marinobacter sp.]|nr:alpha-glucan family phosphorylase [Marinobacter sp.]